jgi:hypothetical protein
MSLADSRTLFAPEPSWMWDSSRMLKLRLEESESSPVCRLVAML